MEHLNLLERVDIFKCNMDPGAIYFEFADGYCIAAHYTVYEWQLSNSDAGKGEEFESFVTRLSFDNNHGDIVKIYYKAYDLRLNTDIENGIVDPENIYFRWVDLQQIMKTYGSGPGLWNKAFELSSKITQCNPLHISIGDIKEVRYTDQDRIEHTIEQFDGIDNSIYANYYEVDDKGFYKYINDLRDSQSLIIEDYNGILNFPTKFENDIKIKLSSYDNPSESDINFKNDIKIEIITDSFYADLKDCLFWVGGVFVDAVVSEDGKTAHIINGVNYLDTIAYKYNKLPVQNVEPNDATLYPDPDSTMWKLDYNVRIFKWKNIKIDDWIPVISTQWDYFWDYVQIAPAAYAAEQENTESGSPAPANAYPELDFQPPAMNEYNPNGVEYLEPDEINNFAFRQKFKYIKALTFKDEINPNAHIIMVNGLILDKQDYYISKHDKRTIILKNQLYKLKLAIRHWRIGMDNCWAPADVYEVNKMLEKPTDFSLIQFYHEDELKKALVNRSTKCAKNYPYPLHVTFSRFVTGDIVTLNGAYEPYLPYAVNTIQYPLTNYMDRLDKEKEILNRTRVERLWISEIPISPPQ